MSSRILLLLATIFFACSTTRDTPKSDRRQPDVVRLPAEDRQTVPPGHCRMVGTVLEILKNDPGTDVDGPCSKAPCVAGVRVDSVLGYGSAFGDALGQGKRITVRFLYTLAPTKELLPSLPTHLPGLTVGSRFQADVGSTLSPELEGRGGRVFVVGLYELR